MISDFSPKFFKHKTLPNPRIPGTVQEEDKLALPETKLNQRQPGDMLMAALQACAVNLDSEIANFHLSGLSAVHMYHKDMVSSRE